jgi:hypothetical protein
LRRAQKSQDWFWTSAWQSGERQADADIVNGDVITYEEPEQFEKALWERPDPPRAVVRHLFAS